VSLSLSYRAELANQVLHRLRLLPPDAWAEAQRLHSERPHQHTMVCGLAEHAVELLSEEFGPDLVAVVRAHLNTADQVIPPGADARSTIARGVVLAAFLRDSAGFSRAAFTELFRPLAPYIELGELERTARAALLDSESHREAPTPTQVRKRA
jgi:hypothetical protein